MRLPIAGRSASGISPWCSIVRYEMQRRASSWYGAVIAPVGQAGMQALQLPQRSFAGVSTGNGRSVNSSPSMKSEPARSLIRFVCLPIQPRPALRASGFYMTGAESTKAR
jgi:hypothetical protein